MLISGGGQFDMQTCNGCATKKLPWLALLRIAPYVFIDCRNNIYNKADILSGVLHCSNGSI